MTLTKLDSKGIAIALISTATWATAGIFIRWLPGWSPFAILSGRFLVAAIALLPIVLSPNIRKSLLQSVQSITIWAISLPLIGGYLLGTTAFQMAPVGEVTLLISTSPLFVVAYKLFSRSPIHKNESTGTLLSMLGVGLILLPQMSNSVGIQQRIIGDLMALGSAALLATYVLWFGAIARKGKPLKPINVVFIACLLGCILSTLCTTLLSNPTGSSGLNGQAILVILGLGVLSTAMSTLLYTMAAQRLPALLATAILLTEPVFAIIFSSIALEENPSGWFAVGSFFVLSGLLSIAKSTKS